MTRSRYLFPFSTLLRVARGIRTHKKKVVFFTGIAAAGVSYARDKYLLQEEMRRLCTAADLQGQQLVAQPAGGVRHMPYTKIDGNAAEPEEIFVLLQPNARGGKGKETFNKYGAPLLHLAGKTVTFITARNADDARTYCEALDTCRYLVVAGDDDIILNAISGYLQRFWDVNRAVPTHMPSTTIAIVPLQKRSVYAALFDGSKSSDALPSEQPKSEDVFKWWQKPKVRPVNIAHNVQSVLDGRSKLLNVMHVHVATTMNRQVEDNSNDANAPEDEKKNERNFFSLSSVQAGPVADVIKLADKYWYFGFLRHKFAALRTSLSKTPLHTQATLVSRYERRPQLPAAEQAAQKLLLNQQKLMHVGAVNNGSSRRSWLARLLPQRTVTKEAVDAIPTNAVADFLQVPAHDDDIKWQELEAMNASWLLIRPNATKQAEDLSNSRALLSMLVLPALSLFAFLKLEWFHLYDEKEAQNGETFQPLAEGCLLRLSIPKKLTSSNKRKQETLSQQIAERNLEKIKRSTDKEAKTDPVDEKANEAVKSEAKREADKDLDFIHKLEAATFNNIYIDGQPVHAEEVEVKLLPHFVPVYVASVPVCDT